MVGKKAIAALCAAGAFAAGCDMSDEYLGGGEATASPVERPVIAEGRAAAHIHGPGRADTAGGVEDTAPAGPLARRPHDDVLRQSVKKRVVDLPWL